MRVIIRTGKLLLWALLLLIVLGIVLYGKKDIDPEILISRYANSESKFMNLMGMRVHYRDEGNRSDSVPLVLLHGTSASLLTWDSTVLLLGTSHRIIRFDLPGYGLTGPNPTGDYTTAFYNTFIDSVLTRLQVKRIAIAGNSLGGAFAWQYALAHPEKTARLVLVDAGGYLPKVKPKGAVGFRLAQVPVLNRLLTFLTPKPLVRKSLEDVYVDHSRISDQLVDQYYNLLLRRGNREALLQRMRIGFGGDDSESIRKLTMPTLVVWGDRDNLIPVEDAARFTRDIRGSRAEIVKGVGHAPMEEAPQKFVALIRPFLYPATLQ